MHLLQGILGSLVLFELDVTEALELVGLPVPGHPDALDHAESSEPVSDVVFCEVVGQSLHKQDFAAVRHAGGLFNSSLLLVLLLLPLRPLDFNIPGA
jgi:hypothetical protein